MNPIDPVNSANRPTTPVIQRVGRITVALGLMIIGTALLLDNLVGASSAVSWVSRLWPLILIGFGGEYLIRTVLAARRDPEAPPISLRFDTGGAFLLLLILLLIFGINTARTLVGSSGGRLSFIGAGPSVSRTESRTASVTGTQEVQIDVRAGSVRLERSSRETAEIRATYTAHGLILQADQVRAELDRIALVVTEGSVLKIAAQIPSDLDNISISYVIALPDQLKVRVDAGAGSIHVVDYAGDLDLRSGAGMINVGAGTGSVKAISQAGSVHVSHFQGPVNARASVGRIVIENVLGDLQLDSGTGAIQVREFSGGKVVAETRTGSISASTAVPLGGDMLLKTSAGSINLSLPQESSVRATAQTNAGSVSLPPFMSVNQSAGPPRSGVGTSGEGKYTVTLEAGTGQIVYTTR